MESFWFKGERFTRDAQSNRYLGNYGSVMSNAQVDQMMVDLGNQMQYAVKAPGRGGIVNQTNTSVPTGGTMIGLDYETKGSRDLPVVGLDNYLADPKFGVLIASVVYRRDDGTLSIGTYDFMHDPTAQADLMRTLRAHGRIAAHNAGFERGVSNRIGMKWLDQKFVDSAVTARRLGADSHLEKAAPQLLPDANKMDEGKRLIRKFSLPREDGTFLVDEMVAAGTLATDSDWLLFIKYCEMDAMLSLLLEELGESIGLLTKERAYEVITSKMNAVGWRVDIEAVKEMQRRYLENQEIELDAFRQRRDAKELNFRSTPQLRAWCAARGIKAASFDELHVSKLRAKLDAKLHTMKTDDPKYQPYIEVLDLLDTKQTLGGSSLSKLKVLLNTTSEDGILRNQYMHVGAGQSYRTSGRGVQLQNLKRLGPHIGDMADLEDDQAYWDNEKLARNIRQAFTSRHEDGQLIVGDFSSIESRDLAYLAGAQWKLDAFSRKLDLYKVQAEAIYGVPYEDVTKEQRQTGKVGELSCGYGAGGDAVQAFAEKMGVAMTTDEALDLVTKWRLANPEVVNLWKNLDRLLDEGLASATGQTIEIGNGLRARIRWVHTPKSLKDQHPGAQSMEVSIALRDGSIYLQRVFQGCYRRGRQICYYRPTAAVGGPLWLAYYQDPKTKQRKFYSIYGGKLSGILTQSFAREMFFDALVEVDSWCGSMSDVDLIGQFHDEIVLDWGPKSAISLELAKVTLDRFMSKSRHPGLPVAAEVKSDYRYTK